MTDRLPDDPGADAPDSADLGADAGVNAGGARARAAEAAAARAARTSKDRAPTRQTFAIDPALRIKDPASQIFVAVSIGFFVLVFLYAMAFGKGGAFNPVPTPTPIVTTSPAP